MDPPKVVFAPVKFEIKHKVEVEEKEKEAEPAPSEQEEKPSELAKQETKSEESP